jgi:hypothetical protein
LLEPCAATSGTHGSAVGGEGDVRVAGDEEVGRAKVFVPHIVLRVHRPGGHSDRVPIISPAADTVPLPVTWRVHDSFVRDDLAWQGDLGV